MIRLLSCLTLLGALASSASAMAENAPSGAFFGGATLKLSPVNEHFGVLGGVEAGYTTARGLVLGASFSDLLNGPPLPDVAQPRDSVRRTKMWTYGILLGWEQQREGLLAFRTVTLLGAGNASAYTSSKKDDFNHTSFVVLEPTVGVRVRLARRLYAVADAGWRLVMGSALPGSSDGLLGGPTLNLTLEYRHR